MINIVNCKECKVEFRCTSRCVVAFCSEECKKTFYNTKVKCCICNSLFLINKNKHDKIVKNNRNFYCSKNCSDKIVRTILRKKCEYCDAGFVTYDKSQVCCRKKCAYELRRKKKSIELTCYICSGIFTRPKSYLFWREQRSKNKKNLDKHYCGKECYKQTLKIPENCGRWVEDRESLLSREDALFRATLPMQDWRKKVFKRDDYTCRWCDKMHTYVEAHHIIPLKLNKTKAHDINNGITLCRICHMKTFGKEMDYHDLFVNILLGNNTLKIISQCEAKN